MAVQKLTSERPFVSRCARGARREAGEADCELPGRSATGGRRAHQVQLAQAQSFLGPVSAFGSTALALARAVHAARPLRRGSRALGLAQTPRALNTRHFSSCRCKRCQAGGWPGRRACLVWPRCSALAATTHAAARRAAHLTARESYSLAGRAGRLVIADSRGPMTPATWPSLRCGPGRVMRFVARGRCGPRRRRASERVARTYASCAPTKPSSRAEESHIRPQRSAVWGEPQTAASASMRAAALAHLRRRSLHSF